MNPPELDLKAIFNEALERPAGPERIAYLDQACAEDEALRAQLETLLKAHDEAGEFLATADHTPDAAPTASHRPQAILEGPGTMVGPYKLLQQIGEGGMGVVFMAEQEKPVRRKVALKVIKPGMDTNQVVARFEAERQALAMMDHPNIARVLDVGATGTGRPFFVMELVKGVPITDYADRNQLTPKERLELFMPVCRAIQHAHQKGIIHRDIKPSNVLVTLHDGVAVPKVIDFGVAKAIDQRLTEKTMFTEFGAVIGTLEYMSPEQAEMGALDIDTRSDIYSLGVLLYELLTGSTPLERAKLRKAAFSEILRRIREEEPTKPSTRLSESKDALPSISAQRKMEPARLTKLVRGDLDWIVMKSLEKDRTRRYETATGFARDIQRYLDGDAVEACPPSVSYKLRKFARKHRVALATAGAFALILVAATSVSLGFAYWATLERDRAVVAEKSADGQKRRAQEHEQMAIDAVKRFGEVIAETPELKNAPSLAPLRARLLKEPQEFFLRLRDRFQADKETTPESLNLLAKAGLELGFLTSELGDKEAALRAYEESVAILNRLASENLSILKFQGVLAMSYRGLGGLQQQTGHHVEALASLEKAIAIGEQLVREIPSDTQVKHALCMNYRNLGSRQLAAGRLVEAQSSLDKSLAIAERLVRENPSAVASQGDLASSHFNMAVLQLETDRTAEALASLERAIAINERLARENPSIPNYQRNLGLCYTNMGLALGHTSRLAETLASYEKAIAIGERLVSENPSFTDYRRDLAVSYGNIGVKQAETGKMAEALASQVKGREINERLAREHPSITDFQSILANSHINIGNLQSQLGRRVEALASQEKALAIMERLAREQPQSPNLASGVGAILNNMATVYLYQRQFDQARPRLKQAIEWQKKALAVNPAHPTYRQFLVNHLTNLGHAAEGLGLATEAEQARRELAEVVASDPAKVALEARLVEVLKGQPPKADAERLQLAMLAYQKALHALAVRLSAEAFDHDPKLANNIQAQPRYNAACSAALAGCGQCKDDPSPDEATRQRLRAQALEWLNAELAMWGRVLDKAPPQVKAAVAPAVQHWKDDADLAGIRDEKELARLPEAEREAFRRLWADVDQLLARASGGK